MMNQTRKQLHGTQTCVLPLAWALSCIVAPGVMAEDGPADQSGHSEDHSSHSGPTAHAPIGVMGDQTDGKGEVMLSYGYMRMRMDGMRDNDDGVSRSKVLQDFMVTPVNMDMEMHMFGAMYARLTT
jgi:hypothetical protein